MKLASVRSLKTELFASPESLVAKIGGPSVAAFGARSTESRRRLGGVVMDGIALGAVQKKPGDYKLAVRQQESGPLVDAMTEQIRQRAKGEVDVRYIGQLVPLAGQDSAAYYRARRRPLRIGASISDINPNFVSAGTLGCFVAGRKSPHYLAMLTNNHVIADENGNKAGSPIVQPGTLDGGDESSDLVGELWRYARLKASKVNYVDAAIGYVYEGIDCDLSKVGTLGSLKGVGDASKLPEKAKVYKVGRTTGKTTGRLTAFDIDNVTVDYALGVLRFDNQIEIEGTGNKAFSNSGDSGSMIVDKNLRAIGLLFAGGDSGGTNGKGLTYANPFQLVLDELDVDLVF